MIEYDPYALGHEELHQVIGISRTFTGRNMDSILISDLSHCRVARMAPIDVFLDLMNQLFHLPAEGTRLCNGADLAVSRHDVADIHRLDRAYGFDPFKCIGIDEGWQT